MDRENRGIASDLLLGALAGAAATLALSEVSTYLYDNEDRRARRREDRARGGKSAYEVAAEKGARLLGASLSRDRTRTAGSAIHWALGIGGGMLYGALRGRVPAVSVARGLGFGTAFWLVADEGMVPAAGLTPGPSAFPWQTHARALAAHLAYGVVADGVLAVADRALKPR